MVTAETAVAMPAVIIVLALVVSAIGAGVAQLEVTEAARVGARAAAAGYADPVAAARRAGGAVRVSIERGELTCVSAWRDAPGPLGRMGLRASSRACTWTEPGAPVP